MVTTNKREQGCGWWKRMLDVLRGGALGVCVALIVLGFAAVLVRGGMLGSKGEGSAVIVACLLGGVGGGFAAVRRGEPGVLSVGLCVGGVMWLLLLNVGVLLYRDPPVVQSVGTVFAACLCGGGLAGVLGRNGGNKKRRRRR